MTFIEEAVIGEFISKVSDSAFDISKVKIKQAVENRKNKHQSPESQMYNIVVDVLNKITNDEYENYQDKIYDVAEKILKGFKNDEDNNRKSIKIGLSDICENVDENKCTDFMKLIYREISKDKYKELYREGSLLKGEKESNKISRIEQKADETRYGVKEANEKLDIIVNNKYNTATAQNKIVKKESRTQEYANKWNANMFLNNFEKRDENAGVNVKLSEVYIDDHLPHYIWGENKNKSEDLKELLTEYIEEHNDNKMLLILGQPGIGKSTLIIWITANFSERIDDILVYQFASDLKNIEWKKNSITERILDTLGYQYDDLNGKILIFDGLDEWSIQIDKKVLLDNLYEDLIYKTNIKDFTLIITCRVNYIQNLYIEKYNFIILNSWDEKQIKSFCSVFQNKTKVIVQKDTIENIINNKNILGIPLVLYMVLALNITLKNNSSIVDVYDRIFALEGGIYDRCIDYKRFADPHRISGIKKQIHQISKEIAIWMFENNPSEAYIPQEEYKKVCINITHEIGENNKGLEKDFVIGNFFELKHCEGEKGEGLYFVHRSIYEYFVVETIYSSIENSIRVLSEESQIELAANIAFYLKKGEITNTIGEYFRYKIVKIFNQLSLEKKNKFYDWWESAVDKMLNKGMFYYTNRNINYYENIISKECQCFGNIIKILRLLLNTSTKKYVLKNVDGEILDKYIKYYLLESKLLKKASNGERMLLRDVDEKSNLSKISLCGVDFRNIDLKNIDLTGSNLEGVNLERKNLKNIYLNRTNLRGANLKGANLREAVLREIDLSGANLSGANLNNASLKRVDLSRANLYNSNFQNVRLDRVKLVGTNLSNANFIHSNWSKFNLNNASFNKSNSGKINLQKASLFKANFLWADLRGADLRGADLRGVDLRLADLRGADLRGADLKKANLMFAKFDEEQIAYLLNYDLSKSLVYVEECDRFIDYLKYQNMKN